MKRLLCCVLLLCLGLAGCGVALPEEAPLATPTLPEPAPPGTEPLVFPELYTRPAGMAEDVPVLIDPELEGIPTYSSQEPPDVPTVDPSDIVPISELPEEAFPHVRGPAGTVRARTYLESHGHDPVYADVDGDGKTELVYWCYGPTSGLFTVGLCVYGLEQGWPVLKGCTVFNLSTVEDPGLEADAGQPIFRCTPQQWDGKQGAYQYGEPLWLPVTLADGVVLLNGGELPAGIEIWSEGSVLGAVGSSFSALREQLEGEVLLDLPRCLVWQVSVTQDVFSDPTGKEELWTSVAVTDNGVTVTGTLSYLPSGTSLLSLDLWNVTLRPIPPVEDPEALAALTAKERDARLGPCHSRWAFGSGHSYLYEFWFTEDGKMLTVMTSDYGTLPDGSAAHAELWDMTAGEPHFLFILTYGDAGDREETAPMDIWETVPSPGPSAIVELDSDSVIVHQEENPTRIENEALWERFLAAVEQGEECEVRLRMLYEAGEWDLTLRCDGEVFHLDDGAAGVFRYLIVDEVDDPPASASFRRAVHYLLSEDPDMTWERYSARMVSSAALQDDFPATASLFTIYE